MVDSTQFCVKWNSYSSNFQHVFPRLQTSEHFVDITLACEGQMIKCHKVVLSACSTYFEKLLVQNPCQHPIIFMKDMKYWEVQALVDFMYKGEVNVTQDELDSLLVAAEALQVRGLSGSEEIQQRAATEESHPAADVQETPRVPTTVVVSGAEPSLQPSTKRKKPVSEDADPKPKISRVISVQNTFPADVRNPFESNTTTAVFPPKLENVQHDSQMSNERIKEESDKDLEIDESYFEGDMDGDIPDDDYTNYEQHDDSDSNTRDEACSQMSVRDQPGPSGTSASLQSTPHQPGKSALGLRVVSRRSLLQKVFDPEGYAYHRNRSTPSRRYYKCAVPSCGGRAVQNLVVPDSPILVSRMHNHSSEEGLRGRLALFDRVEWRTKHEHSASVMQIISEELNNYPKVAHLVPTTHLRKNMFRLRKECSEGRSPE